MALSYIPLWKTLLDKGLTKTLLRKEIGISTATLAKMSADKYVSMDVIERICLHLDCQPNDVFAVVDIEEKINK